MGTSGRTLTDAQRQRAFLIAAAIVVGVVLLSGLLNGGHSSARPTRTAPTRSAASAPRIVNAGAHQTTTSASASTTTASAPAAHTSSRSIGPTAQSVILGRARTFLGAYLASEVGPLDGPMRSALTQTATRRLAHRLIRHPVKRPPSERSAIGQVESLQLRNTSRSKRITVDATVGRSGWISALSLDFDDVEGQWLVSALS